MPICCKFQNDALEFNFVYNFVFHCLIHVYSPWAGADKPQGLRFDVNRNHLSLQSHVTSLKKSLKSDFVHICHGFIHIYIVLGQGQTTI